MDIGIFLEFRDVERTKEDLIEIMLFHMFKWLKLFEYPFESICNKFAVLRYDADSGGCQYPISAY